MKLSGFHMAVHSGGEQLKEYSIEVSPDGKKATCWISSQSGKEFAVKFGDGESSVIKGEAKSVHIYTDGHRMRKYALLPNDKRRMVTGVKVSSNVERPFTFADIRTTDEDTVPGGAHVKPDEIGTISVRVFLVKNRRPLSGSSEKYRIQGHPPALIHEQAKKAGQHCVSLGDERPCGTSTSYTGSYNSKKPDLVFEFRYRPTAVLQALGVVPLLKREAPMVIDLEDEDSQPSPKRRKTTDHKDLQLMEAELERLRQRVGELEETEAGPSSLRGVIKPDPADIIDLT